MHPPSPPAANDHDDTDLLRRRLRYQSWHRGCKETDIILGFFCDQHLNDMDDAALRQFEAILNEDDADLFQWLTAKVAAPEHLQQNPVFQQLLRFDVGSHVQRGRDGA